MMSTRHDAMRDGLRMHSELERNEIFSSSIQAENRSVEKSKELHHLQDIIEQIYFGSLFNLSLMIRRLGACKLMRRRRKEYISKV